MCNARSGKNSNKAISKKSCPQEVRLIFISGDFCHFSVVWKLCGYFFGGVLWVGFSPVPVKRFWNRSECVKG